MGILIIFSIKDDLIMIFCHLIRSISLRKRQQVRQKYSLLSKLLLDKTRTKKTKPNQKTPHHLRCVFLFCFPLFPSLLQRDFTSACLLSAALYHHLASSFSTAEVTQGKKVAVTHHNHPHAPPLVKLLLPQKNSSDKHKPRHMILNVPIPQTIFFCSQ